MKQKRVASFVLAAAMVISLLPSFAPTTVAATTAEKSIILGTKALSGYDSTDGYDYIYYGAFPDESYTPKIDTQNLIDNVIYTDTDGTKFIRLSTDYYTEYYTCNPIKWRVLNTASAYDKSDTSKTGILVLSEYLLKELTFDQYDNCWAESEVEAWCNNSFYKDAFDTREKALILTTDASADDLLSDDRIFLLSKEEVESTAYFPTQDARKTTMLLDNSTPDWWLRTPMSDDYVDADVAVPLPNPADKYAHTIARSGKVSINDVNTPGAAVRPAFNLNQESVLFTAPAKNGKTGNVGTLSPNAVNGGHEYKLTVKDDTRKDFAIKDPVDETIIHITKTAAAGETVALNYKNAETGTNEYISAMIVNAYDEILYYGQVKDNISISDNNGSISVSVPDTLPCGTYDLLLFNEQITSDDQTDFSSDFQSVTLNVTNKTPSANDFTFTPPSNLTYDGKAKFATVTANADGVGEITVKYYDENETQVYVPTDVGKYKVKINVAAGSVYAAAHDLTLTDWQFEITKAASTTSVADVTVTYGEELTLTASVEKANATRATGANKVDFWVVDDTQPELLGTADVEPIDGAGGTATLRVNTADKKLKIGENTITAEYGGSVNLQGSQKDTIAVTLNPKTVDLHWTGYVTRTYDGKASNVKANATGLESDDEISVTVTDGDKINASPADTFYIASATELTGDDAMYYALPTNVSQSYRINPRVAEIEWTLPTDLTYDGDEKEVAATVKNVVSDDVVGVILSGNKGVAATSYKAKVEALKNANYTSEGCTNLTRDWTISPKKINAALTIAAPVKNAAPQTSIDTDEYTATVSWTPSVTDKFAANTEYTATITIAPKPNYTLDGIAAEEYKVDGATSVTKAEDENIVTAVFPKTAGNSGGGGGSSASGTCTVTFETNGGSNVNRGIATKNTAVTEPKDPTKEGYAFDGWYTDKKCTSAYDFETKVTKNITLYAKWTADEVQEPSDDKQDDEQKPQENAWKNPFTDAKETDWFFDSVKYANENGLMSGMTSDTFAPHATLTRGMFATVLYRAAGEPLVERFVPFADVRAYMYCTNAINWARRNNIVSGMTETEFAPDDNITREQIAVILYRYAEYNGYDVSVGADTNILSYTDYNEISEYAIPAVQYAVGSGLMKGKTESTFHPKDFATRAEIATILSRFI